jgi:ketosteroid isomerase-like protein
MERDGLEALAQQVMDLANARDLDGFFELVHPDVEFHSALASPVEGRIYRGRTGLEEYFADIDDVFSEIRWMGYEIVTNEGDQAVIIFHLIATGRGSGVPLKRSPVQVWTMRDGRLWRNVVFATVEDALAAARVD